MFEYIPDDPIEWLGWLVTGLFLAYHAVANRRLRLILAFICGIITIVYFYFRKDNPMLVKWVFVTLINMHMYAKLKKINPDSLVDE